MNFLALNLFVNLFAIQMMDLDMTPQEKKKTGIYKLSDKEKAALQGWIDSHYAKRDAPIDQTYPEKHANLSENLHNGHYIRLSDGSLWNIRSEDVPVTQGWISAVEIIVSPSNNPKYPYKLTNSLTGSSVFAKKASQVPKTNPTAPIILPPTENQKK